MKLAISVGLFALLLTACASAPSAEGVREAREGSGQCTSGNGERRPTGLPTNSQSACGTLARLEIKQVEADYRRCLRAASSIDDDDRRRSAEMSCRYNPA
jgi:hypothetical protein